MVNVQAEGERKLGGAARANPGEARARLLSDAVRTGSEKALSGWSMFTGGEGGSDGGSEQRRVGGRGGVSE
jgi:hypothetical protein